MSEENNCQGAVEIGADTGGGREWRQRLMQVKAERVELRSDMGGGRV